MANKFKHFVITRFNLVYTSETFKRDSRGNLTQTKEWLDNRFSLFERFCFPSVYNQNNKNFIWLVLFSVNTPNEYLNKIDSYRKDFLNFIPLFFNDYQDKDGLISIVELKKKINEYLVEDIEYLITTRIDNDDAMHVDFIDIIQDKFSAQSNLFINFNNGLQYDVRELILSEVTYINNPFITRIEKINAGDFQTVYSVMHGLANTVGHVECVDTKPLWLQIIHDKNVGNSFFGKKFLSSTKQIKAFNLNPGIEIKRK